MSAVEGSSVEDAFSLARTGRFKTLDDLAQALRDQGFTNVDADLTGTELRAQLRQICLKSRR